MSDKVKYADIRGEITTGDILLFSGKGLVSNVIKLTTGCKWSHVGMAVVDDHHGIVNILESTMINPNSGIEGVQIQPLRKRYMEYDGEFAIRQLENPPLNVEVFKRTRERLMGLPYEKKLVSALAASALDFADFFHDPNPEGSVFCSETTAIFFKDQHWFRDRDDRPVPPSDEFTPANFAGFGNDAVETYMDFPVGPVIELEL